MILGILSIGFIKIKEENSIDNILKKIESTTSSLNKNFVPLNCKSITLSNNLYVFRYGIDSIKTQVTYSTTEKKIISIKW